MRTAIVGAVLALVLVSCDSDPSTSPTPTRNATPAHSVGPTRVDARTRSFCGHLVALEQQVARDLNGGNGDVETVIGNLLDHVSEGFGVLAEEQNHLEGAVAHDADEVVADIGSVALWKPGDPGDGFSERVLALVDRIDAFESEHCPPAG